jgi:hypothetical protein
MTQFDPVLSFSAMNDEREHAAELLAGLGFKGLDLYLAELIPAVEMAWADGQIQPNELAMLESYCEALVERLNRQAGAPFFRLSRARRALAHLTQRRLTPAEREAALYALKTWAGGGLAYDEMRERIMTWAEAVACVDGRPVVDVRELFWLQTLKRKLEVTA